MFDFSVGINDFEDHLNPSLCSTNFEGVQIDIANWRNQEASLQVITNEAC